MVKGGGGAMGTVRLSFQLISALSLAKMKRCMLLIFLFVCFMAVKKLPEHRFVTRTQEKITTLVENGVETPKKQC